MQTKKTDQKFLIGLTHPKPSSHPKPCSHPKPSSQKYTSATRTCLESLWTCAGLNFVWPLLSFFVRKQVRSGFCSLSAIALLIAPQAASARFSEQVAYETTQQTHQQTHQQTTQQTGQQISRQIDGLCSEPLRNSEACLQMRHMRATINSIDAQRDLVVVNYPYLGALTANLSEIAENLFFQMEDTHPAHAQGLRNVSTAAARAETLSRAFDPSAFVVANQIRGECMSCHSSPAPVSDVKWSDVFKRDWDQITKNCNEPGRNPFLCKNMNGLLSAYAQMMTAYAAGLVDFRFTEYSALEVVRILRLLKKNKYFHLKEDVRKQAELEALEIAKMAKAQDSDVFQKAHDLTKTCLSCHTQLEQGPPALKWGLKTVSK